MVKVNTEKEKLEEREEKFKKKLQVKFTIAIISLIIIIVILLLRVFENGRAGKGYQLWDGNTGNRVEVKEGSIEIPGYSNQVVSKENQEISLGNPDKNDVYFIYHIYDGEDEIYTTDLIEPGYACKWNAYEDLGKGTYTLNFVVNTFDIETIQQCNSASTLVTVQIQKY